MRRILTLTDVTRMHEGRVCIAGLDEHGVAIRPVLPGAPMWESFLTSIRGHVICPFSVLDLDLLEHTPDPPHTEDWTFNPWSTRFVGQLTDDEGRAILDAHLDESVASIFGTPLHADQGTYVLRGKGTRSLGTVRPRKVACVTCTVHQEGAFATRISFDDQTGTSYRLAVTDLTWRCFATIEGRGAGGPGEIEARLCEAICARSALLRIGLSRNWEKHPDRCYLQITGVYTLPSYTGGQTHDDLAKRAGALPQQH